MRRTANPSDICKWWCANVPERGVEYPKPGIPHYTFPRKECLERCQEIMNTFSLGGGTSPGQPRPAVRRPVLAPRRPVLAPRQQMRRTENPNYILNMCAYLCASNPDATPKEVAECFEACERLFTEIKDKWVPPTPSPAPPPVRRPPVQARPQPGRGPTMAPRPSALRPAPSRASMAVGRQPNPCPTGYVEKCYPSDSNCLSYTCQKPSLPPPLPDSCLQGDYDACLYDIANQTSGGSASRPQLAQPRPSAPSRAPARASMAAGRMPNGAPGDVGAPLPHIPGPPRRPIVQQPRPPIVPRPSSRGPQTSRALAAVGRPVPAPAPRAPRRSVNPFS